MKKFVVRLTDEERTQLEKLTQKGKGPAYKIKHANILLAVDENGPAFNDMNAAKALSCNKNTVRNVRQRFVEQGLETALERKKQTRPSRQLKLDGEKEARLIAIACREPPAGYSRWTLKLLANELVALEVVDSISDQTVRRTLKKTNLNLI